MVMSYINVEMVSIVRKWSLYTVSDIFLTKVSPQKS